MIVLASNSPRRKELLRLISPGFEIEPAEIDERLDGNIPLDKMPEYLAVKKAEAVHKNHPGDIVIGCDTGVFINNMMIGKPGTDKTAFEILKLLSGKTHRVITGCAVFKGDEMISFSQVTEVERKAVEDAAFQAGARDVKIIEEPIAAAIGAGIDIGKPCGNMIVDIGGGTTDIAVISLGGTVVSDSIKIAGDNFDEAIVRYMRQKHNLLIGERTAEDMKIKIGSAFKRSEPIYMDVRGRNLVTGLPKTIRVSSEDTEEALRSTTAQIVEAIHGILEKTPPELAADIAERGIVLTGGGSLLSGLEDLICAKTGITTMTAEEPMTAVAIGTGRYVEFLAGYRDTE